MADKRPAKVTEAQALFLKTHKVCEVCGSTTGIQAHHIFPWEYSYDFGIPELAESQEDFVALCETEHDKPEKNCHLTVGHLGDFENTNLNVKQDIARYSRMEPSAIVQDAAYKMEKFARLPRHDKLTDIQKNLCRTWLAKNFPDVKPK